MMRFTLPRDMYYGKGALEQLKNIKGQKAVLVLGGGSMKRFGFVDNALGYLKEAGIETRLFENVEPDPSVETVMKGAKMMREFEPDWIISMGGGSPIDAAKAMWVFYEYPDTAKNAKERYAQIARSVGINGSDEECVKGLCDKIDEYNVRLNIPKTLKEFGILEEEFKEKVGEIAKLAVGDACTGSNPRTATPSEMEKLLTCTYYGTEVDF